MDNLNLLLKYKLNGDAEPQVRGAARISVDGLGGLLVYDAVTGKPERISLSELTSLRIDRASPSAPPPAWIQ
jgi:hypothetical protein